MRHKEEIRVSRVYNFSAGPAVLPEEVLQEAAAEMMDYKGQLQGAFPSGWCFTVLR